MEILPSKCRSPPPKPPRRRHSDQLTISASGTFPSSRKKHYDENKLCSKDMQAMPDSNTLGCGSLPANWISDFCPDYKSENSILKKVPYSYSSNLSRAFANIEMPHGSDFEKNNDSLTEKSFSIDTKNCVHLEWTKKNNYPHFEQIINNISSAKVVVPSFDGDVVRRGFDALTVEVNNLIDSRKEYHRRHHSDPVLSHLDKSTFRNGIQKYNLRSHSFFGGSPYEDQDRLCNSFSASCEYKETQHLYEEIKTLKEINNKLWQHLCSMQSHLEDVKKNSCENSCGMSISDFLSSLYYLQKAKDSAMEDRMKVILEERDNAIHALDDMVQIIAKNFEGDTIQEEEKCSDQEIKNLLKEIEVTCNPYKLLHQQRLLLTYLYRSKELRQDHITHELKLAVSEKDNLLEKVKYLEDEIKCLKFCNELWNSDNKLWENNLLNILCQVIQQRDVALSKINAAKKLENLNSRFSTDGNSDTVEELSKDYEYLQKLGDAQLSAAIRHFQTPHHDIKCDLFPVESPSEEVGILKEKIKILSKALEIEVEKREVAEDKCLRLERLVNVLQKKVNGQNVGIHV